MQIQFDILAFISDQKNIIGRKGAIKSMSLKTSIN